MFQLGDSLTVNQIHHLGESPSLNSTRGVACRLVRRLIPAHRLSSRFIGRKRWRARSKAADSYDIAGQRAKSVRDRENTRLIGCAGSLQRTALRRQNSLINGKIEGISPILAHRA